LKIFYGFLVIMVSVGLFLLPVTAAAYDFRTDIKEDTCRIMTGVGVSTGNVTLIKAIYLNDPSTVSLTSDDSDDLPVVVSYNSTNRLLALSGFAESANRTVTVSYDVDSLGSSSALANFIDKVPWIWLIALVCFPIAAIVYIIFGMRN
jgi:hypothetical protein